MKTLLTVSNHLHLAQVNELVQQNSSQIWVNTFHIEYSSEKLRDFQNHP